MEYILAHPEIILQHASRTHAYPVAHHLFAAPGRCRYRVGSAACITARPSNCGDGVHRADFLLSLVVLQQF